MHLERRAGILLHPTSLPGPYGIGDLGPTAHRWVNELSASGCGIWQLLPLGPTGYGDSPYQCFSAFAGNPYLISPDLLIEQGFLSPADLDAYPMLPTDHVDYGGVIPAKVALLDRAATSIDRSGARTDFEAFRNDQSAWLDDFSLFMTVKELHDLQPWWTWEPPLRDRDPATMAGIKDEHGDIIERHAFRQFIFYRQWSELRAHAHRNDLTIVGDAPIFVAADSSDVWANRQLFSLDDVGRPTVVAGVPPDYFSETGQLWGNPLYRWDIHQQDGYWWWLQRLQAVFNMVDVVRLDHFRGFAAYWEVPAGEETAIEGRWVPGPGADFLQAVAEHFGSLPIVAEDLGIITDDVRELRDRFQLPGMKILQFAFDSGEENDFLPHRYPENCVVYSGTHDNDTTRGWFQSASSEDRTFALEYLNSAGSDFAWDLIVGAWESRAAWAIAPLQDVLNLGTEARMNYPSVPAGNWRWRMTPGVFTDGLIGKLRKLNQETGRSQG